MKRGRRGVGGRKSRFGLWELDLVRYDRCMNDFNAELGVLRGMTHLIWEVERSGS
jgi:hypothetical protein